MKIDSYAHIVPPKFANFVLQSTVVSSNVKNLLESYPTLYDLDKRFCVMDKYPEVMQVLTVAGVSVDDLGGPREAGEIAQRVNDEMAELVYKYPDRFAAGVAVLPMLDIDAALVELDRAINELKLRGILIRIPPNGKPVDQPEFMPLYEKMCQHNLPIWFHPQRKREIPDYANESESKYQIWHLWGLVYETTVSVTRLVFSGVLEKYPSLKIITHHCGGMIPYFAERIVNHYNTAEMRSRLNFNQGLTEPPIAYFRRIYTDTAILGNKPALMCAYDFFGPEQLLFGTDTPFDPQLGHYTTKRTVQGIEQMEIPSENKIAIFEDNARQLMRLPV